MRRRSKFLTPIALIRTPSSGRRRRTDENKPILGPSGDGPSGELPQPRFFRTLKVMEVHFTPEQQAQLAQLATKAGTVPERLVTNVVARYLDEEARFLAAVEKGIAAAERGEFIEEEEEMDARLEAMFKA